VPVAFPGRSSEQPRNDDEPDVFPRLEAVREWRTSQRRLFGPARCTPAAGRSGDLGFEYPARLLESVDDTFYDL
jgi:hypothetical protein